MVQGDRDTLAGLGFRGHGWRPLRGLIDRIRLPNGEPDRRLCETQSECVSATSSQELAPGLILAQAIGRWGNYFNQELFGRPSDLPWAIRIAPENRPVEFADAEAFHPTFLYESIWDLLVCLVLHWIARRFADRLKGGDVFLLYVSLYSVGRFFVETLRVDEAFLIGGSIRGNLFVSGMLALGCAMILLLRHSRASRTRLNSG